MAFLTMLTGLTCERATDVGISRMIRIKIFFFKMLYFILEKKKAAKKDAYNPMLIRMIAVRKRESTTSLEMEKRRLGAYAAMYSEMGTNR